MDNVLVDFPSGISKIPKELKSEYEDRLDEVPGIFSLMEPIKGAIESYKQLSKKYDTYILSTAPWKNSSGWSDKNEWVKKYLGDFAHKRLILSHHKNLNYGDYLIDDRLANGANLLKGSIFILEQINSPIGQVFVLICCKYKFIYELIS